MNPVDPSVPVSQEERTWGMIAHLSAFVGFLLPLGSILGPLVVWLTRRDRSAFVGGQAKEALNFNLSVVLAAILCGVLWYVFIGVPLAAVLFVYWIVVTIKAGIKASEGIPYQYSLTLRLVK
ncbi:MAG TPA: DUF4870 domain-containing protein [Steroidobacteraceae bacterium]|nr:DUF4870 domain-containing protein [Steroidobacteraceae bacterium]